MPSLWELMAPTAGLGTSGAAFGTQGPQEVAETPRNGLDNLVSGAGKSILQALMAPGNAYQSTPQNPVTSEQMIEPTGVIAALMAGLPGGVGGLGSGARLTAAQMKAIQDYSGAHAGAANMMLRQGPEAFQQKYSWMGNRGPQQVQRTIDQLDKMATPLAENTTLYRGMPIEPTVKVGDIISDKGFASTAKTSGTPKSIADHNGFPLVEINAPQGSKAIDFRNLGQETGEVVLPRNSALRVTSIEGNSVRADLIDALKKFGLAGSPLGALMFGSNNKQYY